MIIDNYLQCYKKVLTIEKRRSKNKPALEVQQLPKISNKKNRQIVLRVLQVDRQILRVD